MSRNGDLITLVMLPTTPANPPGLGMKLENYSQPCQAIHKQSIERFLMGNLFVVLEVASPDRNFAASLESAETFKENILPAQLDLSLSNLL